MHLTNKSIKNLKVTNMYSVQGALFTATDTNGIEMGYPISIVLDNVTISHVTSYDKGHINMLESKGEYTLEIKNSIFEHNHCVNGPSEIYVFTMGELTIRNTTIRYFSSDSIYYAQAMHFDMFVDDIKTISVENIEVYCHGDDVYTLDEYSNIVRVQSNPDLSRQAPIVLSSGKMISANSLYKN